VALCAVGALGALQQRGARAGEWRAAGATSLRQGGAMRAAVAADPFDDSVHSQTALQEAAPERTQPRAADGGRSVVVRRGGEFDPFEAPQSGGEPVMPASEPDAPAVRDAYDPFDAQDSQDSEPAAALAEQPAIEPPTAAPTPALDSVRAPELDQRGDDGFDVENAFDEPRQIGSPRIDVPEKVAVAPPVEEELDRAENAVEKELQRRTNDRDMPGGVRPNPFRGNDDVVESQGELEEVFPEPKETDEADDVHSDPLLQMAPGGGGLDVRPFEQPAELTPEQQAERDRQLEIERAETEKKCEEFSAAVRGDDIKSVSLSIRMDGQPGEDYPFECGLGEELYRPRSWPQVTYMWKASGLCHKPLYFEQVQLERYGHSWPPVVQPLLSGAHFFGTLPILPYKMGITTPNECIYTLGYYRPGSCAPYMIEAVPFTWRAAAFEAGAWTGGSFIFP
jgi:hypothetical protein